MELKDGGPAFPARVSVNRNTNELQPHQFGNDDFCTMGASLRDVFAMAALQSGEASNWRDNDYRPTDGLSSIENTAICAYEFADAMLKARQGTSND